MLLEALSWIPVLQDPGKPAAVPTPEGEATIAEETFRFLNLPELWVLGLVIVPLVVAFAWWSYGGLARLARPWRIGLASLRGLAIALCLFALFQPAFEIVRYTKTQTQVHVLIDDSASMQRKDSYPDASQRAALAAVADQQDFAGTTRLELVRKVIERPGGLVETLRKTHDVRLFRFARKPMPIRDLSELQGKASRTQIGDALDLHLAETGSVNLDSVILVSDGCNNAGLPPVEVAGKYRSADLPIWSLGVGDPSKPKNIRLIGPPGPKEALRREEVAFDTTLSSEGLEGRRVTVTLQGSRDGGLLVPLATSQATLAADGVPVKVRVYHAFDQAGDWSLKFSVTELPEETSFQDNTDSRFLRVNNEKIRVLFIDDVPRWDYRYIQIGLQRVDESIETQVYLCDANQDFHQEHSDTLDALKDFPRTRAELFRYHVILLGDVPPERIAPTEEKRNEWLRWLCEFVAEGGGVGFQWGPNAMPERYRDTPLQDLLPVVLDDPLEVGKQKTDWQVGYAPRLDNPGRPQDIVLLRRDPEANAQLWNNGFERLFAWYPVQQPTAGSEVLLRHPTEANKFGNRVIAAAGYYPRGRTFFLGTDETFRWRKPYGEKYQDTFWRNTVRWLAAEKLRRRDSRIEMRLDKVIIETGEQVQVTLLMRDQEFRPNANAEATVFFRRADGVPQKRVLRPSTNEDGTFVGSFQIDEPGTVSILAYEQDNPQGRVLAREDVLVKIPDKEMEQSSQDRAMLDRISEASKGGKAFFLAETGKLLEQFKGKKPYEHEVDRATRPAWDSWWTLGVVLFVLAVEWILRKRERLI